MKTQRTVVAAAGAASEIEQEDAKTGRVRSSRAPSCLRGFLSIDSGDHAKCVPAIVALLAAIAPGVAAGADGDPITSSAHTIDVFQGPVLGSSRAVGLSGAFSSIAEGVEGLLWNPAAVANRYPHSLSWWDYDLDVGFLLPTGVAGTDYDNDGETSTDYRSFSVGLFGGALQFGYLGGGAEGSIQNYEVETRDETGNVSVAEALLATAHLDTAFGFLHGQLVLGGGIRVAALSLDAGDGGSSLAQVTGFGLETGMLVRPDYEPFRFSVVARTDVREQGKDCSEERESEGFFLPCQVVVPWEVQMGFSWMVGPKPYNPRWTNPHRVKDELRQILARRQAGRRMASEVRLAQVPAGLYTQEAERIAREEEALRRAEEAALAREEARLEHARERALERAPRRYVLLSTDLALTGPVQSGIGIESFVRQVERRSGNALSLAPRFGVESEIWPDRLRLRGGSYLEPSRFDEQEPRPHGTFGLDLRLFYTTLWDVFARFGVRASGVIDVAPRYLQFAASVGIWH